MLSSPTTLYDANVLAATAEFLTHNITAREFVARDGRYSLTLPGGATLDPARSGRNRLVLM
jgi:hypothetical protein